MGVSHWIAQNLFDLLSTIGVIGGLFFAAITLREDTKTRKVSNLLAITANHREVWQEFFTRPDLSRILDGTVDLRRRPIRPDEEVFVNMVILHLSSMYEALKGELVVKQEGLRRDAGSFFSLPIPKIVWERTKLVQNRDFVAFVEDCFRGGHSFSKPSEKFSTRAKK